MIYSFLSLSPDGLIVSHLPYGPTAYFGIQNCVLRHDIKDGLGTVSEAFPHIIFENFTTPLGQRVRVSFWFPPLSSSFLLCYKFNYSYR